MAVARDLYNLSLLFRLMVLLCQILFKLAIIETILMRISTEQVSFLHRIAPRYLKLVTSSSGHWSLLADHAKICTDEHISTSL